MLRQKDFIVILIRLFLGYLFFSAGMCKLTHGQFGQLMGPPLLEDSLAKYGLGLFARIVAISQVVCGMLLLSHRFSTLGAVMLLPMNLSIMAVTISMGWTGTPYVNGFFTLLNITILVYDWHKLKILASHSFTRLVRPTALDEQGSFLLALPVLGFAVAALFASRFSLSMTNVFALLCFMATFYHFLRFSSLSKLQLAAILLTVLNMVMVTLAVRLGKVQFLVAGNTVLIIILVAVNSIVAWRIEMKRARIGVDLE